jgi:hypothetical protein
LDKLARARRRQRDTVLIRLDLPGNADLHRSAATLPLQHFRNVRVSHAC